jgi:nicotinate-nucleotide pyrophosphorylase (carboxylating)
LIGDKCLTESSGNIIENTIRHYAECGVDYISSGALTHSVYNMDLSFKSDMSTEIEIKCKEFQ